MTNNKNNNSNSKIPSKDGFNNPPQKPLNEGLQNGPQKPIVKPNKK